MALCLEAIQIIRDTLREGGLRHCHQMTQRGGGECQPKCHVSFFLFIFCKMNQKSVTCYLNDPLQTN